MTNRPRLVPLGGRTVPGVLAIALFGLLAAVILSTNFESWATFPDDAAITSEIGYAMFDYDALQHEGLGATEPFLVSFILIAIVLDAALDASLVLAKREDEGETPHPASYDSPVAGGSVAADGGTTAVDSGSETRSADADGTDESPTTPSTDEVASADDSAGSDRGGEDS